MTFFLGGALSFNNSLSPLRGTIPGALLFANSLSLLRGITPFCFKRNMRFSMPNTIKENIMPKSKRNKIGATS